VLSLWVFEAFSKAKIYDEDVVFIVFLSPNQKVVWLYISVNDPLLMNFLYSLDLTKVTLLSTYHLYSNL
jgi:hypothetical protein